MAQQRKKLKSNPIKTLRLEAAASEFTDGGAAAGTYDSRSQKIPAGAIVLGTKISAAKAFIGDTTAVAIVGSTTDDEAFCETAGDVFTTAGGYGAPATTGADTLITAAAVVRITITSGSDFTLLLTTGGQIQIEVYYLDLNAKSI